MTVTGVGDAPEATAVLRFDIWLDAVSISEVDDLTNKVIDIIINDKILMIMITHLTNKDRILKIKIIILDHKIDILIYDDKLLMIKVVVINGEDVVLVTPVSGKKAQEEKGSAMASAKATSTSYTAAAQALIKDTRAMRERIPHLVIPSEGDGRRLAPAGSVPPQFIEQTVVAVRNSASLVRNGGLDADQTRDLMSYAGAFDPLADELEALAHFVRHSVIVARNKAGRDALTTYALAKLLAKRPETADLLPRVEDMRRALGRTRKGKSKAAAAAEETSETDPSDTQEK